jgi:hypothetical protein
MKNIHVLPTNKPSRLSKDENDRIWLSINFEYGINDNNKQNIYITSDEEIKEGDWYCSPNGIVSKHNGTEKLPDNWNKIILTTDQDLIKDGVQAIDDEFLEWFVKNPSCEEAKVEITEISCIIPNFGDVDKYRIAIPKEEPKQLFTKGDKVLFTGKMLDEEVIDKVVTVFYTLGRGEVEDMSDIMDEYTHIYRVWNKDLKHIQKEEPKQETIEEAAEKYVNINVAKNAAKLMYKEHFIAGAKWQQQRSYSGEEAFNLLMEFSSRDINSSSGTPHSIAKWFEQFKKK